MASPQEPESSAADSMWSLAGWKSSIYDNAIVSFTTKWYATVLGALPDGCKLLDVGIGTGAALVANAEILRMKNITVAGVDYDAAYIARCEKLVADAGLSSRVTVKCCSFYDYHPADNVLFDHVYFSGSFMILPDGPAALKKAVELMRDREDGRLYFTQTFELQKNVLLEWAKPKLSYWTTIDFGNVTYVEDFDEALHLGNTISVSSVRIEDGKAKEGVRESRLVVARSTMYVPEAAAEELG